MVSIQEELFQVSSILKCNILFTVKHVCSGPEENSGKSVLKGSIPDGQVGVLNWEDSAATAAALGPKFLQNKNYKQSICLTESYKKIKKYTKTRGKPKLRGLFLNKFPADYQHKPPKCIGCTTSMHELDEFMPQISNLILGSKQIVFLTL